MLWPAVIPVLDGLGRLRRQPAEDRADARVEVLCQVGQQLMPDAIARVVKIGVTAVLTPRLS